MAESAEAIDQELKEISDREGKYLTFVMADEEYGIGILKIKEIIGMMPITSVSQTPGQGYPGHGSEAQVQYESHRLHRAYLHHRS